MYIHIHQNLQVHKKQIDFNNLPWEKIFLRVNRLIKQLYVQTRRHNLKYAYNLQMYMVNSIELKVFVLKYIVSSLYTFYYLNKSRDNNFYRKYKSTILQNKSRYKKVSLKNPIEIKKNIKQYLIYFCTKPMLDARLAKYWKQDFAWKINKYDNKKNYYYCYQNIRYIEKKLELPCYIKENIVYFLETLNYIDLSKFYQSKHKTNINNLKYVNHIHNLKYSNFLIKILSNLYFTDSKWYKLNYIKKIKHVIKVLRHKKLSTHYATQSFKYYLRFRFLLKKIRFSRYLDFTRTQKSLARKILSIYQNLYYKKGDFVGMSIANLCNNIVNQITYFLIKRDNLSIVAYSKIISAANTLVNKIVYIFNIKRYYCYYIDSK